MNAVDNVVQGCFLDGVDRQLINLAQHFKPQSTKPYLELAETLGISEDDVLKRFQHLQNTGVLSRYGAVFNHKKAGFSTLVALSVPEEFVEATVDFINQIEAVNHNYLREHKYNVWFVVTAKEQSELEGVLQVVEQTFNFPMLDLPMEKAYFIDLGFPV